MAGWRYSRGLGGATLRIGVVCEGLTDFHAIECFLGHAASERGLIVEFVPIQPVADQTSSDGGWGNVLLWLSNNPPSFRIQKYFGGGLFGGDLSSPTLDGILIQLDSDILGQASFSSFVEDRYGIAASNPPSPPTRADAIAAILERASGIAEMTEADVKRHVIAPAVESTEAWCVAAFSGQPGDFEALAGQELIDAFMTALEVSEGNPATLPYAVINKSVRRRKTMCSQLAPSSGRIIESCTSFRSALEGICGLS